MIEEVKHCLKKFQGHGLEALDKASLMNRVDTKFVLPSAQIPVLLEALRDDFSALEIEGRRIFRYESQYYDTPDMRFYYMHHSGRLNRFKVRTRHYVDTDQHYLEVKFKNNKKRTIKRRVSLPGPLDPERHLLDHLPFLRELGLPNPEKLQPSLINSYHRIALASEHRGERLTMDINLQHRVLQGPKQSMHALPHVVIAELKQARVDRRSPFFRLVRELGIRSSGFSKYCMGVTLAHQNFARPIKCNRFKPALRRLDALSATI